MQTWASGSAPYVVAMGCARQNLGFHALMHPLLKESLISNDCAKDCTLRLENLISNDCAKDCTLSIADYWAKDLTSHTTSASFVIWFTAHIVAVE